MDVTIATIEQQAPISSSKVHLDESTHGVEIHGGFCLDPVLFPALKPALEKAVAPPSAMDTCYPKCMSLGEEEPRQLGDEEKLIADEKELMQTFDLEELGLTTPSQASEQQEKSIVVDYEDSDGDRVELRDQAAACALSACGPLIESEVAADSSNGLPACRRSRCGSVEMVTLKGKSMIFQQKTKEVSPSTSDTDVEEEIRCSKVHKLCLCEMKLHRSLESCWLVSSGQVYDVTGLVAVHPGGIRSILRKAGGPDCACDMKFHTKNARKMMEKCFIGKLEQCGDDVVCAGEANCSVM